MMAITSKVASDLMTCPFMALLQQLITSFLGETHPNGEDLVSQLSFRLNELNPYWNRFIVHLFS